MMFEGKPSSADNHSRSMVLIGLPAYALRGRGKRKPTLSSLGSAHYLELNIHACRVHYDELVRRVGGCCSLCNRPKTEDICLVIGALYKQTTLTVILWLGALLRFGAVSRGWGQYLKTQLCVTLILNVKRDGVKASWIDLNTGFISLGGLFSWAFKTINMRWCGQELDFYGAHQLSEVSPIYSRCATEVFSNANTGISSTFYRWQRFMSEGYHRDL